MHVRFIGSFARSPALPVAGLRAFYKAGSLIEEWDNLVRQVRARQDGDLLIVVGLLLQITCGSRSKSSRTLVQLPCAFNVGLVSCCSTWAVIVASAVPDLERLTWSDLFLHPPSPVKCASDYIDSAGLFHAHFSVPLDSPRRRHVHTG